MTTVNLPSALVTLHELVTAIARASVEARPQPAADRVRAEATASLAWESRIRELCDSRSIPGRDLDNPLQPEDWLFLDLERDLFAVDDLNACRALKLDFKVADVNSEPHDATHKASKPTVRVVRQSQSGKGVGPLGKLIQRAMLEAGQDKDETWFLLQQWARLPEPRSPLIGVADTGKRAVSIQYREETGEVSLLDRSRFTKYFNSYLSKMGD